MLIRLACILSIFCLFIQRALGQDTNEFVKYDSSRVYQRIEKFSEERRVTRMIFPLVFRPVVKTQNRLAVSYPPVNNSIDFSQFEGKTIRKISIQTIDPFGFEINDSVRKPRNFPERFGNSLHIASHPVTIRNYLLIKRNEPFDSLLVMESERLVRKQRFVRDIQLIPSMTTSDSVDILIKVQDAWSIIPDGSISSNAFSIKIREDNFLGTGHQFNYITDKNLLSDQGAFELGYSIPNIDNTYIHASVGYILLRDKSYSKVLAIDRSFYSPYARWAGGIKIKQEFLHDSLILTDLNRVLQKYKFNSFDYWGGSAWQLLKGRSEDVRNTNLVVSGRWLSNIYLEKPSEIFDSINNFSDENTFLARIGINSRKYFQEKFLFRFGLPEDIPIGRIYSLSAGYQTKGNQKYGYLGFFASWGNMFPRGYLEADVEYGTFFNKTGLKEGAMKTGINCFTGLLELGSWHFRQFIKANMVVGYNRRPTERLYLNDYMGVGGFDNTVDQNTRKIHLTVQTQFYAPWNLLGFRLGPFLSATLGFSGDEPNGFRKSRPYSFVGLGVLIKNDFLNSNFLQLSLSYYPVIPALGKNQFLTNSLQSSDFGLQEFELGKPELVNYQ